MYSYVQKTAYSLFNTFEEMTIFSRNMCNKAFQLKEMGDFKVNMYVENLKKTKKTKTLAGEYFSI